MGDGAATGCLAPGRPRTRPFGRDGDVATGHLPGDASRIPPGHVHRRRPVDPRTGGASLLRSALLGGGASDGPRALGTRGSTLPTPIRALRAADARWTGTSASRGPCASSSSTRPPTRRPSPRSMHPRQPARFSRWAPGASTRTTGRGRGSSTPPARGLVCSPDNVRVDRYGLVPPLERLPFLVAAPDTAVAYPAGTPSGPSIEAALRTAGVGFAAADVGGYRLLGRTRVDCPTRSHLAPIVQARVIGEPAGGNAYALLETVVWRLDGRPGCHRPPGSGSKSTSTHRPN